MNENACPAMDTAPLIFLHWGDSPYLQWTFELARGFNPNKRVILLGDKTNEHYQILGIEHHQFEDYTDSEELRTFERVFQYIAGPKAHGNEKWLRFNFRRWFITYNFLCAYNFDAFWTFDSDTLVLTRLSEHESAYREYQCTEQCAGSCMSGFVQSRAVVHGFLDKINELFQRSEFLDGWRRGVKQYDSYSYTEMSAYVVYQKEAGLRTVRLNELRDGTIFDDCISLADDMETYEKFSGTLKKLYFSPDGGIYCFHLPSSKYVRLLLMNMSWVPEFIFRRVYQQASIQLALPPQPFDASKLKVMPVNEAMHSRWEKKVRAAIARMKSH